MNLAEYLKTGSKEAHTHAETRTFVDQLISGELDLAAYANYLAQLAVVYEALESRAPKPGDPALIHDSRLPRLAAIEHDLEALGVSNWRETHPPLTNATAYADYLRELDDGLMYVAHHYTRYLGDLSGGQIIARMLERHYGATAEQLAFYNFEEIEKPVIFKREYHAALDALEVTEAEREALLAETKRAFEFNASLFDELEQRAA